MGGLGELFEDVERGLVFLAALHCIRVVFARTRSLKSYLAHANPRLGDVDEQAVLCPFPCALSLLCCEICAVLLEVDLYNEGDPFSC